MLWGSLAAMVVLPAMVLALNLTRMKYAFDTGSTTITAKRLQAGEIPTTHNVTVTDGEVDLAHVIEWKLLKNGSEQDRWYFVPLRPKGAKEKDTPVQIIITTHSSPRLESSGVWKGLLRNVGGEGASEAVIGKFKQQGLKVSGSPILIEHEGSGTHELMMLLLYIAIAFFAPLAVLVVSQRIRKQMEDDATIGDRVAAAKAAPGGELVALEAALFELVRPLLPSDHEDNAMVQSNRIGGGFKVTMTIGSIERPATPEITQAVDQIWKALKKQKIKPTFVTYNFLWEDSKQAWRMTGGPM